MWHQYYDKNERKRRKNASTLKHIRINKMIQDKWKPRKRWHIPSISVDTLTMRCFDKIKHNVRLICENATQRTNKKTKQKIENMKDIYMPEIWNIEHERAWAYTTEFVRCDWITSRNLHAVRKLIALFGIFDLFVYVSMLCAMKSAQQKARRSVDHSKYCFVVRTCTKCE